MQPYVHSPLDIRTNEIRLLRIRKLDDGNPDSITLQLRHTNLDDKRPFNALPYVWGQELNCNEIIIDDSTSQGSFSVRQNLLYFLLSARQLTAD